MTVVILVVASVASLAWFVHAILLRARERKRQHDALQAEYRRRAEVFRQQLAEFIAVPSDSKRTH